jgi:hypothetical protein
MAIQICVRTAFGEVPKKALIRRCCLIHRKNSSTCHLARYNSAMVSAGSEKSFVTKVSFFPVAGSWNRTRRSYVGYAFAVSRPVRTTVWSQIGPVLRSTGWE